MPNVGGQEASIASGRPIELFQFDVGATTYRYTSATGDVVFASFTWTALPGLRRNKIVKSSESRQSRIELEIPTSNDIPQLFLGIQPAVSVNVTISRIHEVMSPSGALVIFKGVVSSSQSKDEISTLLLTPFNEIFNREFPRNTYQGLCNHVLYDSRCQVVAGSFDLVASVTAQANNGGTISVAGAGSVVDPTGSKPFQGGYVINADGDDFRLILDQIGDDLTLLLPFRNSVLSTTVTVQQGCDHSLTTCRDKFSNVVNYGGFPYIPSVNPFTQNRFEVPPAVNTEADTGVTFT